jgi:two-component system response regulator FixJ
MSQAKVYLVEDDSGVLEFLESTLANAGYDVSAYESPLTLLQDYDPAPHGCLVLDLWLPHMNGLQLNEKLRQKGGDHPFIIITGYGDVEIAIKAMRQGAIDFLEKPIDVDALLGAVRIAVQRDKDARERRAERQRIEQLIATLTGREKQVLQLYLDGSKTDLVAETLDISIKTVYVHRSHIFKKMHVASLGELITKLN